MTAEEKFFLQILSDHLKGNNSNIPPELSWEKLVFIADQQELSGMLYYQIMEQLPELPETGTWKKSLERSYQAASYYYYNRIRLLQELREIFQTENISYVLLKGAVLAESYPCPMLRTMGDCDLQLQPEDAEHAGTVLVNNGYTATGTASHEWTYTKDGMELEIHDGLLHDVSISEALNPNTDAEHRFSDSVWNHVQLLEDGIRILDETYHFVYLLIHLKTHFLSSGVGFRQFSDLCVAASHWNLDLPLAAQLLQDLGLLRFAQVCMALCMVWFGIALPPLTDGEAVSIPEDFARETAEKLFRGGVFGFDDEENKKKQALLEQHLNNTRDTVNSFTVLLARFFPSYDYLVMGEHNAFLRGRKWLLPAAWAYRFYRGLTGRSRQTIEEYMAGSFLPEEEIQKNEELMQKWGL